MGHRHDRGRDRHHEELNRGDYRGDFGPEGYRHFDNPPSSRRDEHHQGLRPRLPDREAQLDPRDERHERTAGRWQWRRFGREGWQRGRTSGGYGSTYDAWSQGAGFGPGREEEPRRGGFADQDWQPTRPARGRGIWAGDWENEEAARRHARDDYRGRGPRGYRRSDDRIREEVCDRLTDDPSVDASEITVEVQEGEIILSGTVSSRWQKRRAEECVEDIPGVHDVVNRLRVRRDEDVTGRGGAADEAIEVAADRGKLP